MGKQRIVIICPGRGSYTRETSNYFSNENQESISFINWIDDKRRLSGNLTIKDLDSKPFKMKTHMSGENASSLIYGCSVKDFMSIDKNSYEVVAITGNSMGWYTALALGGAVSLKNGYQLIQSMGSMMQDDIIGGQIIYPIIDEEWRIDNKMKEKVFSEIQRMRSYISIFLGGYILIGGKQVSLNKLLIQLPKIENYPLQLPFHAAFHTPLLEPIANKAKKIIHKSIFSKPLIPLIDGFGNLWSPFSTDISELYQYTLNDQITCPYNFSKAISVAVKEFCPDKLVLLGPGNTLGGPVGQILVQNQWKSIDSKNSFIKTQKNKPYLISMGIDEQRKMVSK